MPAGHTHHADEERSGGHDDGDGGPKPTPRRVRSIPSRCAGHPACRRSRSGRPRPDRLRLPLGRHDSPSPSRRLPLAGTCSSTTCLANDLLSDHPPGMGAVASKRGRRAARAGSASRRARVAASRCPPTTAPQTPGARRRTRRHRHQAAPATPAGPSARTTSSWRSLASEERVIPLTPQNTGRPSGSTSTWDGPIAPCTSPMACRSARAGRRRRPQAGDLRYRQGRRQRRQVGPDPVGAQLLESPTTLSSGLPRSGRNRRATCKGDDAGMANGRQDPGSGGQCLALVSLLGLDDPDVAIAPRFH